MFIVCSCTDVMVVYILCDVMKLLLLYLINSCLVLFPFVCKSFFNVTKVVFVKTGVEKSVMESHAQTH